MPTFTDVNQFLQREEPLIFALRPQLVGLLLGKLIKPTVIAEAMKSSQLLSIDYKNGANQFSDEQLVIGYITIQKINKLLDDGDISKSSYKSFFKAAREFLIKAIEYLLATCPFQDEILCHATWIDFKNRLEQRFTSVEYFVHRYPEFFDGINMDHLNEQFLNYQLLLKEDVPSELETTNSGGDTFYHVDKVWGYLKSIQKPGSVEYEYDSLYKVAEIVLTIPHSNAGEEHIFSFINKNKTPSRSSLDIKGTLSSLTTVKTHIDSPLQ